MEMNIAAALDNPIGEVDARQPEGVDRSTALLNLVSAMARRQARIDHKLADGSESNANTKH
jgi:hypothetical protein